MLTTKLLLLDSLILAVNSFYLPTKSSTLGYTQRIFTERSLELKLQANIKPDSNKPEEAFPPPSPPSNKFEASNHANAIQEEMLKERIFQRNGLIGGCTFLGVALLLGNFVGMINPIVSIVLPILLLGIISFITESYNEYSIPLADSNFEVKESTIKNAGKGLFSNSYISKDTYILEYEGEVLTEMEYFYRYPNGDGRYVAEVKQGFINPYSIYIDGVDESKSGLARYMNSKSQEDGGANVYWKKQRFGKQGGRMYFYALRDIEAGEELFFDYGNLYWDVANNYT